MKRRAALFALLSLVALGCSDRTPRKGPVKSAELGVFFGGQVQERNDIPFVLDPTQQSQGFRLLFWRPLTAATPVRWEIDRPGPRGRGRAVELGDAVARAGQEQFDQEIRLRPGDPLGTWNVRVWLADALVIDRSVSIYDADARRRARKERALLARPRR
ncbi:MAG: hypothetical protein U0263_23230 [Polyangiaceae bacterium]